MKNKRRKLLLKSLEGMLSDKEQQKLNTLLKKHPQLEAERQLLRQTQKWFATDPGFTFQPFFAERVSRRLVKSGSESPDLFVLIYNSFKRLAIAASLIIAVLVSINILQNHASPGIYNYMMSEMSVEEVITPDITQSLEELL